MPRPPSQHRPPRPDTGAPHDDAAGPRPQLAERLQKVLAAAGLGSRRKCEELILAGRVEVDRVFVTLLGTRVDPAHQDIRVDGVALPKRKRLYYLVHKPPGVISTARDQAGRPRVIDLVPAHDGLFPVGRLDVSSEGAILVTNDGELANQLTHPRYGIAKTYQVEVAGRLEEKMLQQLRHGIYLAEAFVRMSEVYIRRQNRMSTTLEVVLREGRNREIRRMLARVGHKVLRLKRIAVGPLRLGELPSGAYRPLEPWEVRALRRAAQPGNAAEAPPRVRKRPVRRKASGETAGSSASPAAAPHRPGKKRRPADRGQKREVGRARPGGRPAPKPARKKAAKQKGRR